MSKRKALRLNRRGPLVQTGPRRDTAQEAIYGGAWMRSRLEVDFAKALDARGIAWKYEPERLRGGNYLVDFYLPDLRCWVEVKGRFEARDQLLLPLVANYLHHERGEHLFLWMKTTAYRVRGKDFVPLSQADFWEALDDRNPAAAANQPGPPDSAPAAETPDSPDSPDPDRHQGE